MNATDHDRLLADLSSTPSFLESALKRFDAKAACTRPQGGGFSLVEQIWHLADLEREGYGERIRRILGEDEPELADFDGDRIARERQYIVRDAHEGLRSFKSAREKNLERLRRASTAERTRTGTQEGVGRITLADVPRMMSEHDRGHREEIDALLIELGL